MNVNNTPQNLLEKAFDIESFREEGHQMIDKIADQLRSASLGEGKVLQYIEPEEEYEYWKDYHISSPGAFFNDIIDRNIRLHHKRYIGHQVAAPAPITALAGLLSDITNVGMGIYEMGSAGTAIERVVAKEFSRAVGYSPDMADGVLTSGGTLANLTALLGARASYQMIHSDPKPYILVSEEAHFCIDRAAMTMGMSPDQVIKIKTLDDYSIDPASLEQKVKDLNCQDKQIMAIVACACSTSTGSYDDLHRVADICAQHNIWMHVDGAHGGAALFSDKYRSLCSGVERADSVIIDAHKMMLTPALATAVLFKRAIDSYRSLSTEAAYLFESSEGDWYQMTKRTYETTKYMIGIKIFLLLRYYGLELIDQYVTRQYDMARSFADIVQDHQDFEIGHVPMSNILCFRYKADDDKVSELNSSIRSHLIKDGKYYIVQTVIDGDTYLRVTIMNPFTTIADLKNLLNEVSSIAYRIIHTDS